jgi:redox-sensitive bicupin YhaK (pirin superfamily)
MKKIIKRIIPSVRDDIADLQTHRALPIPELKMIDPFLFLNHHGPQIYPPHNQGLPFGPHPHRGFETVTFILAGDIAHRDSQGHESIIQAGGIQWMTAGRGLVHEEVSSEDFKRSGGPLEILQLWVNLPAHLKMTTPHYKGLQKNAIPVIEKKGEGIKVQIASGSWEGHKGAFETLTGITALVLELSPKDVFAYQVPSEHNVFFYLIEGELAFGDTHVSSKTTVEFHSAGSSIEFKVLTSAKILLCHALPLQEPVVSYGPFVMNTQQEIKEAFDDYHNGKF